MADGAGRALQLGYNHLGEVTLASNAFGQIYSAIYDIKDRQSKVTDANAVSVTNNYDLVDELLTQTWPDGTSDRFGYAASGLVVYTNRDSHVTLYRRDTAGRLTSVTNANNEVVQVTYNPASEIISLVDGLSHTTSWQYNQFGWLTNKIDGLNRNAFRYAYNPNGWVTNRWTPEKGNTGYAFDNVGNLKAVAYPISTIKLSYDLLNRLSTIQDGILTNWRSYTAIGQLAGESNAWTSVNYSYTQGLRTTMAIGTNWTQTYGYDTGWLMTNTASPAGPFGYS